jgi:hypothetical protein
MFVIPFFEKSLAKIIVDRIIMEAFPSFLAFNREKGEFRQVFFF